MNTPSLFIFTAFTTLLCFSLQCFANDETIIFNLLADLQSREHTRMNRASRLLADKAPDSIRIMARMAREGRLHPFLLWYVLQELPPGKNTRSLLLELARDPYDKVAEQGLDFLKEKKHFHKSLCPDFMDILHSHPVEQKNHDNSYEVDIEWNRASTLWTQCPGLKAATLILARVRKKPFDEQWSYIEILDDSLGHKFLTEKEILGFFLVKMDRLYRNIDIINLFSEGEKDFIQWPKKQDRDFVLTHKDKVRTACRKRLSGKCHPGAALTIAFIEETESLRDLCTCFARDEWLYAWETSYPDPFNSRFYPHHVVYEHAITSLTEKSLADSCEFNMKEMSQILADFKDRSWEWPDPRMYALYRFYPEKAFAMAAMDFSKGPGKRPLTLCLVVANYVIQNGMKKSKVKMLLGRPEKSNKDTWYYRCDYMPHDYMEPFIRIIFDDKGEVANILGMR